ncbi:cytochrome c biogenesis CcdA family protein [Cytobacillus firmus]|uniref:Cytochrome c biogenesis CcdA family protein n=1 Tax=Cytobacillus firmus TaxID=1399 RepID=A0AA46Q208_CYTFI|nr:cytochrome c biogenesis CcdA family protein [Cytobacillus firmus]UYG98170.1 cytochrome c biogenesis CcdA family protein [Cytobacillus firmus]
MNFIYEGLAGLEAISPYVYLLVFLGGVLSALSVCYIPILIMFSGYMGGRAKESNHKSIIIGFIIGMIVISAIIGIFAALVGKSIMTILTVYQLDIWIPVILGAIMGLQLLGVIKLKMPQMIQVQTKKPKTGLGAFALGLPFGLVITPCTVPIFIMIITYVAVNGSIVHGALLLSVYAIGKGLVMTLAAVSSISLLKDLAQKWSEKLEKIAGVILILTSLYIVFFSM